MIDWLKKATSTNVSGNFKFHIKSPSEQADTSSTICVTTYTDKSESAMLPCHYKWFRVRNGIMEESMKFRGNSYVCDSSDIGAVVRAEIVYSGQAEIKFGPIKLSAEVKKSLGDALINRSIFLRGQICLSNHLEKECQFKIFEDMIKVCHAQSELNFSFNYSIYEPRIEIVPRDATRLCIIFSQNMDSNAHTFMHGLFGKSYESYGNDCRMEIKFGNRLNKDIFLMTLKAFYTKKQLSNSVVIHKIEESSFNENQELSLLFEIESLRTDVTKLNALNENKERERSRLFDEVGKLEREIEEIVITYTKLAEEKFSNQNNFNQSFTVLTAKRDEIFGRKCENLQRENLNLNERIKLLTNEIDDIRFNTSIAKKNQTVMQPNFTHMTTIRSNNQFSRNDLTSFDNVLDQISESRISDFSEDTFLMSKRLERANEEKEQLEKKLEKSFKTIDDLEKKLKTGVSNQSLVSIGGEQNKMQINSLNSSLFSVNLDLERVQSENSRLSKANESLKLENRNLQNKLSSASSKIIIQPNLNDSVKIPISNRLWDDNEALKKEILILKKNLEAEELKSQSLKKEKAVLQKKNDELIIELSMNRKNQEVLNRSQHLSLEMENYSEEQIKVLREHNELLLAENEKLSKAVEKYIGEARENIKLRKEILNLKERENRKLLNPEVSELKSCCSKHNSSNSNILDTSALTHEI